MFRIVLMLEAIGMNRLMSHSPTPTTIRVKTMFIKGIFLFPFKSDSGAGFMTGRRVSLSTPVPAVSLLHVHGPNISAKEWDRERQR
jgi:hypothetical protein